MADISDKFGPNPEVTRKLKKIEPSRMAYNSAVKVYAIQLEKTILNGTSPDKTALPNMEDLDELGVTPELRRKLWPLKQEVDRTERKYATNLKKLTGLLKHVDEPELIKDYTRLVTQRQEQGSAGQH